MSKDELSQKAIYGLKAISGQKAISKLAKVLWAKKRPKSHFWKKAKKNQFDPRFFIPEVLSFVFSQPIISEWIAEKKNHNDAFWSIFVLWWLVGYLINGNFATASIYDFEPISQFCCLNIYQTFFFKMHLCGVAFNS